MRGFTRKLDSRLKDRERKTFRRDYNFETRHFEAGEFTSKIKLLFSEQPEMPRSILIFYLFESDWKRETVSVFYRIWYSNVHSEFSTTIRRKKLYIFTLCRRNCSSRAVSAHSVSSEIGQVWLLNFGAKCTPTFVRTKYGEYEITRVI